MAMSNVIRQLPDKIANQIAAGEVIQRPASAVKELLENAIDAGGTKIQLLIKDGGKELIQVIDNGRGMSPMDARMSFERHATSKIKDIEDLFAIKTMGFRGEALASIAAVAQVLLLTRSESAELGVELSVEGSQLLHQEPAAAPVGTSFSIRNLFYNVPARRKFLKSTTWEYKQIIDEFTRVALAYPNIQFKLVNNNTEQFYLRSGSLKARIVDLLGARYEKHLLAVEEEMEYVRITGYIGKPEAAARTRGNQYFFVNDRFIKSAYLNHAVVNAYDSLLPRDSFPFHVLFIEIDPSRVDINVHPTKQEVKFEDERILYSYLQSAIRHSLARYNVAPSIDFSQPAASTQYDSMLRPSNNRDIQRAANGALSRSFSQGGNAHFIAPSTDPVFGTQAQSFPAMPQQDGLASKMPRQNELTLENAFGLPTPTDQQPNADLPSKAIQTFASKLNKSVHPGLGYKHQQWLQWQRFLIATTKSGVMLIDHKRAQERIYYERLAQRYQTQKSASQQILFPLMLELNPGDAALLQEALPILKRIGLDLGAMGGNAFAIQGAPPEVPSGKEQGLVESILEGMKNESSTFRLADYDQVLRTTAKRMSELQRLTPEQAEQLIDQLFATSQPEYTPNGQRILRIISEQEMEEML